ncbi:MAG: hypothetical protein WBN10_11900, partial [Polyangiales bacterium]
RKGKRGRLPDPWREQEGAFLASVRADLERAVKPSDPKEAETPIDPAFVLAAGIVTQIGAHKLIRGQTNIAGMWSRNPRRYSAAVAAVTEALEAVLPDTAEGIRRELQSKRPPLLHERAARAALLALEADPDWAKRVGD